MKRKLFLSLLLIVVLLMSTLTASAAKWRYMKVVVQDARVRKGPGASDIITSLDKGTKVICTARANKAYYKIITPGGHTGYIFRDHVKVIASADSSKVYVTTAKANLRRNARAGSTLIKTLKAGTFVKVLSVSGGWTHVKTVGGKKGYIRSDLLKKAG